MAPKNSPRETPFIDNSLAIKRRNGDVVSKFVWRSRESIAEIRLNGDRPKSEKRSEAKNRSMTSKQQRTGANILASLRFATRGLKTAYRSLEPSAGMGISLWLSRLGNFRDKHRLNFTSRSQRRFKR